MQLYSNLFNFIQHATLFKFIQNAHIQKHKKKTLLQSITKISFNLLSRHLSQLCCSQQFLGTYFWLLTKITRHFTPSQFVEIVHWHLHIAFFLSFAFDFVPCHNDFFFLLLTLLYQLSITLFLRHIYTMQKINGQTYSNPKNLTTILQFLECNI